MRPVLTIAPSKGSSKLKNLTFPSFSLVLAVLSAMAAAAAAAKPMEFICYSPYRTGQAPGGAEPTEAQIQEDFRILAPMVTGIRTYSSQGIHGRIPRLAQEAGIEVHVGAWIGKDENANQAQVNALIALAKGGNPAIKGLIIGNEVLLRMDIPKARLLEYIRQVRAANTGIPVTTADIYQRINEHSADLLPAVDYVMAHVHPFWENQAADKGAAHVVNGWKSVKARYPGKAVIIGETGFPSAGQVRGGAVPGESNQARFTEDLALAGAREGMKFMLFTSFDEEWKGAEGPVGANWGIWKADRKEKLAVARVRALPVLVLDPERGLRLRRGAGPGRFQGLDALGRFPGNFPAGRLPVWTVEAP